MSISQDERRLSIAIGVWLVVATTLGMQACSGPQTEGGVMERPPERPAAGTRYLFYLHGRIVEDQGPEAVSPEFGPYAYGAIVRALAASGATVISEVRSRDTDPEVYAEVVAVQVRRLLEQGIRPADTTVIGASKGSVIAMLVSSRITEAVRYVLLANCNEFVFRRFRLQLHGDVLSIYEASDSLGGTCLPLFEASPGLGRRQELRLQTGERHGFIFRPLDAWVRPAPDWAHAPES